MTVIKTGFYEISADREKFLQIKTGQKQFAISPPVFEINGKEITFVYKEHVGFDRTANGGTVSKIVYEEAENGDIQLFVWLKTFESSPIFRFQYELFSKKTVTLTKKSGHDSIIYTAFDLEGYDVIREVQFAQFIPHMHTFAPVFRGITADTLTDGMKLPGPILLLSNGETTCLTAYEHGASYPDSYLSFYVNESRIALRAEKGNYYNGMPCDEARPFKSVWFELGFMNCGEDEALKHYRHFMLNCICERGESRKPYIFYNTWNYQERGRYFSNRGFIEDLNFGRVCGEIDIAQRMGIDVFVIDTGWYIKTGDWIVNNEKFPDMLVKIKEKLDGYGMKLGLWFNPIVAAKTSEAVTQHPEYRMSLDGNMSSFSIWETEESYPMCLCSDYWEYFAKKCVSLYKELGVRYFKWDGIDQYGCNSPLHDHGGEDNTDEERADCYNYMMGLRMIRIVEYLQNECPEVIVDFDITESGRFVGLGFLSVGKYFLINNGPYAKDFDLPQQFTYLQEKPVSLDAYTNIFFYPGAARQRFCRQGTRYDSFIPSVLFLTHYLPDSPRFSQNNSLAALALGGNGIWGDLTSLADEDIIFFAENLTHYKKVREYVTASYPVVCGDIGTSPEIHEKIDTAAGKGLICFFTHFKGEYTHVTQRLEAMPRTVIGAKKYAVLPDGRLSITVSLETDDAATVFIY